MRRFIEGENRQQVTLMPECLDDYIGEDNPVRVVDAFVEELDLCASGFEGVEPAATGRPSYHPSVLLKLYIYGYLNRIQSSRRLEREAQRNVELMWLTGRLAPDFKTIADFRRDNGQGIRNVCRRFIVLCRELKLFTSAVVAIDLASGSVSESWPSGFCFSCCSIPCMRRICSRIVLSLSCRCSALAWKSVGAWVRSAVSSASR